MTFPSQAFHHTLNALKAWPSESALDFAGQLSSDVTIDPLPAGRCVHVDSVTTLSFGSGPGPTTAGGTPIFKTGVTGTQMAIFLLQGSQDFDVQNVSAVPTDWYKIQPAGISSGLVATGGYELETTEFDTAQTYLPNQPLRAIADDTDDTDGTGGGCLTNQGFTFGTTAYVGVVSRGVYTNAYGQQALAFWPVYAPTEED